MAYQITKQTVVGQFNNPLNDDIFQVVGPGDDNILALDYKGLFHPGSVPAIQASLLEIDINFPVSVTNTNPATSLYQIAIYAESRNDGAPGSTLVITISWFSPAALPGPPRTITLTLPGDSQSVQEENYVVLAVQNSVITVSTAFSAGAFHYDMAAAIAILPTGGTF